MNNNDYCDVPVATPTLVYGQDVSKMSEGQVFSAIKGNLAAIRDLEETGIDSTRLAARVNDLKAANAVLIQKLDSFGV